MLEAHGFCCVDSVQSGSALLIGVMQALRGKLKVAALLFRISRTETCVHSWNYTRAVSLHFGQGVRAAQMFVPRVNWLYETCSSWDDWLRACLQLVCACTMDVSGLSGFPWL